MSSSTLHRGPRAARPRVLRLRLQPGLHGRRHALRAGRRRHQADRRGDHDDRRRVRADRRRAARGGRARQGPELRKRAARPLLEDPKGRSCLASAERCSKGASASPTRCWRDSTPFRRRRAAGRAGRDRRRSPQAGRDRPVRGRRPVRGAAGRSGLRRGRDRCWSRRSSIQRGGFSRNARSGTDDGRGTPLKRAYDCGLEGTNDSPVRANASSSRRWRRGSVRSRHSTRSAAGMEHWLASTPSWQQTSHRRRSRHRWPRTP